MKILAIIAVMENGPNRAAGEHSVYNMREIAIRDVAETTGKIVTPKMVDEDPAVAQWAAERYLEILQYRLAKRTGQTPKPYQLAGAWNAGAEGWLAGRGREYAERFDNLWQMEATEGNQGTEGAE